MESGRRGILGKPEPLRDCRIQDSHFLFRRYLCRNARMGLYDELFGLLNPLLLSVQACRISALVFMEIAIFEKQECVPDGEKR